MTKKILVLPHRRAIERLGQLNPPSNPCWIAVFRPSVPASAKAVKPRHFAFLEFDDVTDEKQARDFGLLPFDEAQAFYAAEVLLQALQEGVKEFIFSCDAGISRSAGLAEAFACFLKEMGFPFEKEHLHPPNPNPLARQRLYQALKALKDPGSFVNGSSVGPGQTP